MILRSATRMDQVSPALQFGADKVETRSWESSSPQECHSPRRSVHTPAPCGLERDDSPPNLAKPEIYSVLTMENNPDESRDSTVEPLTPANLHILQEQESVVCKEEKHLDSDYGCSVPLIIDDDSDTIDQTDIEGKEDCYTIPAHSVDPIDNFGDYQDQMVDVPPSAAAEVQAPKRSDVCTIPQCLQFGTYLPREQQNKNVMISLEGAELWHQFYQAGTEMIITKSGRRMFPGIVISIGGLESDAKYSITLEFNPVDNARYKYINTKWVNIGKAEAHCEDMLKYVHPESPSTGKHWMSSKISFKKIKVTNNKNHKKGQVVALNSMHKYQPRVVLSKFISKKNTEVIFTHDLVECTFIGVTAYQNDQVTQLKIDHNPFAKAFRETGADNDTYGYGMMGPWPISPLLSPYGPSTFPDGQALPVLSPSCIPPAGPSPLPQFNAAFGNWESPPPYSPSASSYRPAYPNAGTLSSPSLFQDHRQMISSRLMVQESPPISPLLYSPNPFPPNQNAGHSPSMNFGAHQFSSLAASSNHSISHGHQKPGMPISTIPETWTQRSDFTGATASLVFEASTSGLQVGYSSTLKASSIPPHQQSAFAMPKIEPSSSPIEMRMDVCSPRQN